jgi:hypothetical protein
VVQLYSKEWAVSPKAYAAAALLAGLWAGCAQAALVVSTAATSNVNCSGGVCTATAANAVLNAHDLMVSLAHGDTTLVSGSTAQDIEFDTPVHWTSAQRLTLDSYHAISFTQPVMSEGAGGMTIKVNDGGTGGDFTFTGKGRVAFWNLSSSLIINGASYTLANDLASLAAGIASNSTGHFAFANNYDASKDGAYAQSPVSSEFDGVFEGLGSTISHLTIHGCCGLFDHVGSGGTLRDVILYGGMVNSPGVGGMVGMLVGWMDGNAVIGASVVGGVVDAADNAKVGGLVGRMSLLSDNGGGTISRSHATARVFCKTLCFAGGLVGENEQGTVTQSSAGGSVKAGNNSYAGGLVGFELFWPAVITLSSATGPVAVGNAEKNLYPDMVASAGGLIGLNAGLIDESYATGSVTGGAGMRSPSNHVWVGGLVGTADWNGETRSTITHSYARGAVSAGDQDYVGGFVGGGPLNVIIQCYSTGLVSVAAGTSEVGGFIGRDTFNGYANAFDYWDQDTSGISDPSRGAGDIPNDPGITGLTTAQLQSGLPAGFDPTIWDESPGINNGMPYLLALVP